MPRTSITLMPLADTFRVTLRPSDATKYVFFCTFGSKRRFVRRCECEMLCPKPGTAPVTWHTAAMVSFLIWLPWGERPTQGHLSAHRDRELCASRRRTKKAAFLRSTLRWYPTRAGCASCGVCASRPYCVSFILSTCTLKIASPLNCTLHVPWCAVELYTVAPSGVKMHKG